MIFKKLITIGLMYGISATAGAGDLKAPEINMADYRSDLPNLERSTPKLKKAFIDTAPADRKDGIPVGEIDTIKESLQKLAQEIADNQHTPYDSLLIAQNNKLVFESYYSLGRVNLPHPQASATKAYTALAIGRAIQLGYLTMEDLDKPVTSFLKGLDRKQLVKGADLVTLNHAMSMQSGIRIAEEKLDALLEKPEQLTGKKLAQIYLSHSKPITLDSQTYLYQGSDPMIAMLVLDAVVPGSASDFIKKELLEKMGIDSYHWKEAVSGVPQAGSRAMMTSRSMVKWGTLVLNKGKWNGHQLIPAAFITKATGKVAVPTDDEFDYTNFSYGYFFWRTPLKVGDKKYLAKFGWGGGGQYVISIEDLDLVIAITGRGDEEKTLGLIEQRILPVFVSSALSGTAG
ncbi:serine hydrolase [Microbulbifer sp. MLAF003]|uniref:serine hydrolase domain-containing protein n=1 Tax=Microbulbifer sp. MLAF003 TaxID=3032582 RepID=UPI0024AD3CF0|nr:serine hydrolase [Microbulbifer sp. MLAF003]WHI51941.1 serine hydrolase [Microbulbifer sp. MLAF003]